MIAEMPIAQNWSNTMKGVVVVIFWAVLSPASVSAEQVCPDGVLKTTATADFIDHGDGTLTHKYTGLMWKKCVEGLNGVDCATGTASMYSWQEALQLADGHSFAGYSDWRMPNIKELTSIVERSCYDPAINLTVFSNDPDSHVWSGSPAAFGDSAWFVRFYDGNVSSSSRGRNYRVRLVRGGH